MTLEELNTFIEKLVCNEDFKNMLTGKVGILDDKVILELNNVLLSQYNRFPRHRNIPSLMNLKVNLNSSDYQDFVVRFYETMGISKEVTLPILQNKVAIQNDKDFRAVTERDGLIKLQKFDNSLGWLVTLVHEMAHAISKNNSKGTDNLFTEVEAKVTEQVFYQYLVNNKINIILNENNSLRALTAEEVQLQRLLEMDHEREYLYRYNRERAVVNGLRNNLKFNKTYCFSEEQYENMDADTKVLLSRRKNELTQDYVGLNPGIGAYRLNNGRHLDNEYRFVIARLFVEYTCNHPDILNKFGEYLMSKDYRNQRYIQDFFRIVSISDLVKAEVCNYQNTYDLLEHKENIFLKKDRDRKSHLASFDKMSLEDKALYEKMRLEREESKENSLQPMKRVLEKSSNPDSNGYISTLLLTLGVGFISGVVAIMTYLFISR